MIPCNGMILVALFLNLGYFEGFKDMDLHLEILKVVHSTKSWQTRQIVDILNQVQAIQIE